MMPDHATERATEVKQNKNFFGPFFRQSNEQKSFGKKVFFFFFFCRSFSLLGLAAKLQFHDLIWTGMVKT
jgi:hypothetical protein